MLGLGNTSGRSANEASSETLVTGIFFLIPIVVVFVLLGQVFKVTIEGAQFFEGSIEASPLVQVILINLTAAVLVLIVVYILGRIAEFDVIGRHIEKFNRVLNRVIPGFSLLKNVMTGSMEGYEDRINAIKPVLAQVGGGLRLGFEIDRAQRGDVVVFLPNSPNAQTGITIAVPASEVVPLSVPPAQILDTMERFGAGLVDLVEKSNAASAPAGSDG